MNEPKIDRWQAVHNGDKYCAPACGGGCTYADYVKAVADAQTAALAMGEGWEPVVWENLGWHSKIVHPHCEIYLHRSTYWIDMRLPGLGQISNYYDNPKEGLREMVEEIKHRILQAQEALNTF